MEFSGLEETLLTEATILAKGYSPLRDGHMKWQHSSLPTDSGPNIEFSAELGVLFVKITHNEVIERYTINALLQRIAIKKTEHFQAALIEFWRLLNPFHLKTVSRQLWHALNSFLYETFSSQPYTDLAQACAKQDTDIDFLNKTGLTFEDFKHSLFEFLDCTTKSKLANEYTRLLKTLPDIVSEQMWFKKSSLHSKLHMKSKDKPSIRFMALPQIGTPKSKSSFFFLTTDKPVRSHRSPKVIDFLPNRAESRPRNDFRRKSTEHSSFTVTSSTHKTQRMRALLLA